MSKRFLISILVVLLSFGFGGYALAAGEPEATFFPSATELKAGDIFTVTVGFNDVADAASFRTTVEYDEQVLALNGAPQRLASDDYNIIIFSTIDPNGVMDGTVVAMFSDACTLNGDFVEYSFTVKSNAAYGATQIDFTAEAKLLENNEDILAGAGQRSISLNILGEIAENASLAEIMVPEDITDVAEESDIEQIGLPDNVTVKLADGTAVKADVVWDTANCDYDKTKTEQQTVTINGTIKLPEGVANPDDIPLVTKINIATKAAAGTGDVPDQESAGLDKEGAAKAKDSGSENGDAANKTSGSADAAAASADAGDNTLFWIVAAAAVAAGVIVIIIILSKRRSAGDDK